MGADPTLSDNGPAMSRNHLIVLAAVGLCGCTSFRDDVLTICDSPDRIGDTAKTPGERMQLMGAYAEQNVKSKEGKAFLATFANLGRGARNQLLRKQAAKMDINPCHLADIP